MKKQLKLGLLKSLKGYINDKKPSAKLIGFIDGYEQCLEDNFSKNQTPIKIEGDFLTFTGVPKNYNKPKLKKGKWYLHTNKKSIFLFNGEYDEDGYPLGYGFDLFNDTFYEFEPLHGWSSNVIEATKEQVKNAFRNHFKKLGFKDGVDFKDLINDCNKDFDGEIDFDALFESERVYNSGYGIMFEKGKFATIIK